MKASFIMQLQPDASERRLFTRVPGSAHLGVDSIAPRNESYKKSYSDEGPDLSNQIGATCTRSALYLQHGGAIKELYCNVWGRKPFFSRTQILLVECFMFFVKPRYHGIFSCIYYYPFICHVLDIVILLLFVKHRPPGSPPVSGVPAGDTTFPSASCDDKRLCLRNKSVSF